MPLRRPGSALHPRLGRSRGRGPVFTVRDDFQQLAAIRVREARVLLDGGCPDGAYCLCGYAIECALKAVIAKQTREFDFPAKDRVNASYAHDPPRLLRVAGLDGELELQRLGDPAFRDNWNLVVDWSERARYGRSSQGVAQELYKAVTDPSSGVLTWLQGHW